MSSRITKREGAVLPLVAVLFPMLILLAGFAINIAYIQLSATELKIATDSAARAAGRVYAQHRDEALALNMANEAGALNRVAGKPVQFNLDDLVLGNSVRADANSRYEFVATNNSNSNALRIVGRRTNDSANGAISTFFPTLMGVQNFELSTETVCTQMEVDVALVIDRSGSMAYATNEVAVYPPFPQAAPIGWDFGSPAPNQSRWLDVVEATKVFLTELTSSPHLENVALATYADMGKIDVPLTSDYSQILAGLDVYTQKLSGGGTNIAGGLSAATSTLRSSGRDFAAKVAIVLTDGHSTVGPNPIDFASSMSEDGVLVISVTFANEADQSLMSQVASAGKGFHKHAEFKQDLKEVFREISRQLPTLMTQ